MSKFNVNTLPTIKLNPNYEGIGKIMHLLYTNLATLPIPQGGEQHGNISIIMKLTLYTTLTNTASKNPPDPGVYPTIAMNSTAYLRYQLQLQHDEERIIYNNIGTMDEVLKNQVIDAVRDMYLK